jgi:UDP-N-acetylglucosamine--dolichyl-phosphate N-acetylglucosaminephosphotransferase
MDPLSLLVSALCSFVAAYLFLPWLIRSLRGTPAVGKDLNKPSGPLIPEMGGLGVILGFYVGVAVLALFTFEQIPGPFYYASITAALGAGVVGLMDDMFNLRKRWKALLPFVLALPLGAVAYGSGNRVLLGLDIGMLIAIAIPLGVTSAANAANMLEGFNGLGAGLGVIMAVTLVILSLLTSAEEGLFLLFPLIGSLLAFLSFNLYPARVFPGDSMTLFTGATLACAAIISSPSMKAYGAMLFIPMIIEFGLKARGRFQAENYGRAGSDGRLSWDGRIESVLHVIMRGRRLREWEVVLVAWAIEGAVCATVILAAAGGI